ncbi:MAG: lysophospholipid acyltransferase family protein [Hyphomicrobiaceae bacterium]
MIALRSTLFNLAFYIVTALFLVIGSPLLFGPRAWAMAGLKAHARASLLLLRWIAGIRMEVRGRERIPRGAALVASKHQSAWDTFALVPLFADPALVMKVELLKIPFYGWFSRKFEMIFVARDKRGSALKQMLRDAKARRDQGRQILIFPEGNRRAPGAEPDYKPGVMALYDGLGLPCVPMALNSGLYWPRRSFWRYPGTIVVEVLEPIPAGLPRKEFLGRLETEIETATARLAGEGPPSRRPRPPSAEPRISDAS